MSAIDALIKQHLDYTCKEANKDDCAFVKDVVQLRLRAAEADALRDSLRAWAALWEHIQSVTGKDYLPNESNFDMMIAELQTERDQYAGDFSVLMDKLSLLDDVLNDTDECEAWSGCADVAEQFDPWESIRVMTETAKMLRATVAAQAQTIETARDAIDKLVMRIKKFVDDNELDLWDAETLPEIISARAWLAANAQTPGETGPVSAWAAIDKAMTEHPELFSDDADAGRDGERSMTLTRQQIIDRILEYHNETNPEPLSERALLEAWRNGRSDPCGCTLCQLMQELQAEIISDTKVEV